MVMIQKNYASSEYALNYWHGTTTLAFVTRSGIIVAVDSRASMGNYISSSTVKKVNQINSYMLGTMAGGAADCTFWENNLGSLCKLYEIKNSQKISISGASKMFANMIYNFKNSGLSIGAMLIGWDQNGPNLYYLDSEGARLKVDLIAVGSGSTFAYGILDNNYKFDMSLKDAINIAKMAIFYASNHDPFSGGNVNLYLVRKEGWVKLSRDDLGSEAFFHFQITRKSIKNH